MAIVEAMQGVLEQSGQAGQPAQPPQPPQPGELPPNMERAMQLARDVQAAQARAVTREQLQEQIQRDVQRDVRRELREAVEDGRLTADQAGAMAQQIAARAAEEAVRAAEVAGGRPSGRQVLIERPGQQPIAVTMPPTRDMIPPQVEPITYAFFATLVFIIVGLPIARAWARWLDRRGTSSAAAPEVTAQLRHLQQSVEAIAIEVERISEAQRFSARMLSEGAAQPVEVRQGERVGAR